MAKVVNVAVVKVGPLTPTKFHDSYPYHLVILKDVDTNKEYKLNLQKKEDKKNQENYKNWMNNLKLGNVLAVGLQDNGKNVNQFHAFKIVKNSEVKVEQRSDEITKDNIKEQTILFQLDRIEKATTIIEEAKAIIRDTLSEA